MIAVGIGCRRGSPAERIAAAIGEALARAGLPSSRVDALAAPDFKAREAGIAAAAANLGLPLRLVERSRLDAVQALCATSSAAAERATGLGAVAEAAALAACGRNPVLVQARIARDGVTCAVARGDGA
ncbi:MAG: cobalamin biosynthesis protein [Defluviicoccus sp.]|nr:cobalamin biosynthesis protein [Defluviicoccus sp.]